MVVNGKMMNQSQRSEGSLIARVPSAIVAIYGKKFKGKNAE